MFASRCDFFDRIWQISTLKQFAKKETVKGAFFLSVFLLFFLSFFFSFFFSRWLKKIPLCSTMPQP